MNGPPLVALDPGHGGTDRGKVGPEPERAGLRRVDEADYTLAQALLCEAALRRRRLRTLVTRRTDRALALVTRADMANGANARCFVSVHWNAAGGDAPRGTIVMHHRSSRRGRTLARRLLERVSVADGDPEPTRWERLWAVPDAVRGSRWEGKAPTVLARTRMPAVILEVDFASHPDAVARMVSLGYQLAVADAVADAVEDWLTTPVTEG